MVKPTAEQQQMAVMLAKIAELEAKLARKAPSARIKVAKSGGISFYGVGRWPVTLYVTGWQILAEALPEILAFAEAHKDELSTGKDDVRFKKAAGVEYAQLIKA
jgi:hypothetical protein